MLYDLIFALLAVFLIFLLVAFKKSETEKKSMRLELEVCYSLINNLEGLNDQDSLTGILHNKGFKQRLSEEVARAERYDTDLCLGIIDLDHFKAVNDTYGHLVGDEVLVKASLLLQEYLRSSDVLARYGGEEFTIIFPSTNLEGATAIMSRLLEELKKKTFSAPGLKVSFSGGIAQLQKDEAAEALIVRADGKMYQAKHAGRSRVIA